MTKTAIWNQIKETFTWFDAKELKLETGKSYAQVTKQDLQLVWEMLVSADEEVNFELAKLQKEMGEGANQNLSSECGGVTGNTVNQSEVVINSSTTLSDNNDTGNDINLTSSTNVATETSDNVTEFKGIPVDHYNFKHEVYIDSVLKDTSGVLISKYLGTHAVSFNDGEQRKSDITLLEAVKLAKQWLGFKQPSV